MKHSRAALAALIAALIAWSGLAAAEGESLDSLFGDDAKTAASKPGQAWRGYLQGELARTTGDPAHWSRADMLADLTREGRFSEKVRWKIGGRLSYDAAYDRSSFYPQPVRQDQRAEFMLRENYLDIDAGDWDWRIGRQHIVWGEMVGLFFADVVSAKDQRQFILPEFDYIRIPQWAARAEYFKDDVHSELIWIPYASYDNIGKPGGEFYPLTAIPGRPLNVLADEQPAHSLRNSNLGVRLGTIKNGWDVAGFAYRSHDSAPVFVFDPSIAAYRLQHDPITQVGATLAKDLGSVVLKSEAVYTRGRRYFTNDPAVASGLVRQNTFNYVVGLEFALPADINLNVEVYDNVTLDRDPKLFFAAHEAGTGMLLKRNFGDSVVAQALYIRSLNRNDWMFAPSVKWGFQKNWGLTVGLDIFDGPPTGAFGRFRNRDRIFSDLRYSF